MQEWLRVSRSRGGTLAGAGGVRQGNIDVTAMAMVMSLIGTNTFGIVIATAMSTVVIAVIMIADISR